MFKALRREWMIGGIAHPACLGKLQTLLADEFTLDIPKSIPSHMIFKGRLRKATLPRELHIEAFTNERVAVSASREIKENFESICAKIETILKESVDIVSRQNTVRTSRAKKILEYAKSLSLGEEVERMVIITLCDIVLDLLVTEKLSKFTYRREDLENERVGAKIGLLKQKIPVYRSKEISDIRMLRNKVAHGGSPTAQSEVQFALEATVDIFEKF